jgi:hypothetical protein
MFPSSSSPSSFTSSSPLASLSTPYPSNTFSQSSYVSFDQIPPPISNSQKENRISGTAISLGDGVAIAAVVGAAIAAYFIFRKKNVIFSESSPIIAELETSQINIMMMMETLPKKILYLMMKI